MLPVPRPGIQKRHRQYFLRTQQKQDQHTSDTPVAVGEWVNGFELVVDHRHPRQGGQQAGRADELLQLLHSRPDGMGWGRHKRGLGNVGGSPDVGLNRAELSRCLVLPAHVVQQNLVHFADKPETEGPMPHLLQTPFQGAEVVVHFAHVGGALFGRLRLVEQHQVFQFGVCSFNAAGQLRFAAQKGADEKRRIG